MEKNRELETFYYDILHLRKDGKEKLEDIVVQNKKKFSNITDDFEGLCKVFSNHIAFDLDKAGIDYQILNLKDCFCFFDHECIVAKYRYPNKTFGYLLVDISFKQFLKGSGFINPSLKEYPSIILSKTEEGKRVLDSLLTNGFSDIDDETLSLYINSFRGDKEKVTISLESLFPQKYK